MKLEVVNLSDVGMVGLGALSRDRVLRMALSLADTGDIEAISMRKIALALGVQAMSL